MTPTRFLPRCLAIGAMLALLLSFAPASRAADLSTTVAWYDTLGYPDAAKLPYVRVATGNWIKMGTKPPENRYVEGFLLAEDPTAFTVFICSVSSFKDHREMDEPYPSLKTVRFVRKAEGPDYERVTYEALDFPKVASEVLERVRARLKPAEPFDPRAGLQGGRSLSHRARIFAFARACQQKDLPEIAAELMDIAANIRDEQTGQADPAMLRDLLQQQIGEAVLNQAEADMADPSNSWERFLKIYEHFDTQFPASPKVAYAREAAALLRTMIAEDDAHHPKPLDKMTPAEQVAENIYQLRNLGSVIWIMNSHYPIDARTRDGKPIITPVHKLVDLGNAAVPQLIDALDNRRFTRCEFMDWHGVSPPRVMRIAEIAQRILEHFSGRNLYERPNGDGKLTGPTTKQLAEAWWKEVQAKGEKPLLIQTATAGGESGVEAARKLVQKFPDTALDAIQAALRETTGDLLQSEYVEVAGQIPGNGALAFLRSQLGASHGSQTRLRAAEALAAHGQPDGVAAIVDEWRKIQRRLPLDVGDAFDVVGGLITFLAKSGDAPAIQSLEAESQGAPVDVRLAVAEVFLPWPKSAGSSPIGRSVSVEGDIEKLPGGDAGVAIEHLLISSLADTDRRFALKGSYNDTAYEDPRVCDMAALVLSQRWPEKYPFHWSASAAECDGQILRLRNRWRAEQGLAPLPSPAPIVIPAAKESEIAPQLDQFARTADAAARDALTARIVETFGLSALPAVRSRLDASKDPAFRALAIRLASCVREVRLAPGTADNPAKTVLVSLKGQSLTGTRLHELADQLQATLPPDATAVTLHVERAGDGTGFTIAVDWLAGRLKGQSGWDREQAVRCGARSLLGDAGYTASGAMNKATIYQNFGDAFGQALQAEIDAPVVAHLRIQRSRDED